MNWEVSNISTLSIMSQQRIDSFFEGAQGDIISRETDTEPIQSTPKKLVRPKKKCWTPLCTVDLTQSESDEEATPFKVVLPEMTSSPTSRRILTPKRGKYKYTLAEKKETERLSNEDRPTYKTTLSSSSPKRTPKRGKCKSNSLDAKEDIELLSNEDQTTLHSSSPIRTPKRGKYKSYSLAAKKEAVELSYEHGTTAVERRWNIAHSTLMTWRRDLSEGSPAVERHLKSGRKTGGGRKLSYGEAEDKKILTWVYEQRDLQLPVSRQQIQNYARQIVNDTDFKASSGWLEKFCKRHSLSLNL